MKDPRVTLMITLKQSEVDQLRIVAKKLDQDGHLTAEGAAAFIVTRWLPELFQNLTGDPLHQQRLAEEHLAVHSGDLVATFRCLWDTLIPEERKTVMTIIALSNTH